LETLRKKYVEEEKTREQNNLSEIEKDQYMRRQQELARLQELKRKQDEEQERKRLDELKRLEMQKSQLNESATKIQSILRGYIDRERLNQAQEDTR
jgi:hypothetical protein